MAGIPYQTNHRCIHIYTYIQPRVTTRILSFSCLTAVRILDRICSPPQQFHELLQISQHHGIQQPFQAQLTSLYLPCVRPARWTKPWANRKQQGKRKPFEEEKHGKTGYVSLVTYIYFKSQFHSQSQHFFVFLFPWLHPPCFWESSLIESANPCLKCVE